MIEYKLFPQFRSWWFHWRSWKITTALGLDPRAVVIFPVRPRASQIVYEATMTEILVSNNITHNNAHSSDATDTNHSIIPVCVGLIIVCEVVVLI